MRKVPASYEIAEPMPGEVGAVRALFEGKADAEQQKKALAWILEKACGLKDWAYRPGDERETCIALGRQFVGHQIVKIATMRKEK